MPIEFIRHFRDDQELVYEWLCIGEHEGPDVSASMLNPRMHSDGYGGQELDYDQIAWSIPEGASVDLDVLDDTYKQQIHDDMRTIISETWD